MKHEQQVVIKRWIPILEEYERTRTKVKPRAFKSVKLLCAAHHLSPKELRRYYTRWIESKKNPQSILPEKRGPKPGSRRTPKRLKETLLRLTGSLAQIDMNWFYYLSLIIWTRHHLRRRWTG